MHQVIVSIKDPLQGIDTSKKACFGQENKIISHPR